MGTNRWLIRTDGDDWVLEHDGEAVASFPTRSDALAAARRSASAGDGEVVVVGRDGRVENHERFGTRTDNDPVG